jgi:hypothetical protein
MSQPQPRPKSIANLALRHLAQSLQDHNSSKQPRLRPLGYSILSKVKPRPHQGGKKRTTKQSTTKKRTTKKSTKGKKRSTKK